jgi:hypothetical protein
MFRERDFAVIVENYPRAQKPATIDEGPAAGQHVMSAGAGAA